METPIIEKEIHQNLYEVDIDFDLASAAWRANKRRLCDGSFKYKDNRIYLDMINQLTPMTKTTTAIYNLRPRIAKQ
jgi:hypothetical protein